MVDPWMVWGKDEVWADVSLFWALDAVGDG